MLCVEGGPTASTGFHPPTQRLRHPWLTLLFPTFGLEEFASVLVGNVDVLGPLGLGAAVLSCFDASLIVDIDWNR
jgi:hypothetical protein